MRTTFIFFLLLLIAVKGFAQWPYYYQPSAVYKQNHVKTKVSFYVREDLAEIIDSFDYSGLLVQCKYFTNGTHHHYGTRILKYDDQQNLVKETFYWNTFYDSISKKMHGYNHVIETIIEHDDMQRVIKKTYVDTFNKGSSETIYSYNPYMETIKTTFNGNPQLRIIYYDEYSQAKMIIERKILPNGDTTESWKREFQNTYDVQDRIKKSKYTDTPPIKIYSDYDVLKDKYYYSENGLLESHVYITRGGNKNKEIFKYTFY
ncbi:MAG: hypothetical protein ABI402_13750 [Ferruginibacter sp.]